MPYLIEYRVKGSGYFPTDMLRYNNAIPRTSDDTASVRAVPSDWPGPREVELVRCAPNSTAAKFMAEDRWRSFGWTVVRVEKPYNVKADHLRSYGFDERTQLPLEPMWDRA